MALDEIETSYRERLAKHGDTQSRKARQYVQQLHGILVGKGSTRERDS